MTVYDLTHPLTEGMPVYPGTPAPTFRPIAEVATDRYGERMLSLASHVGTHVDAPAHVLAGGLTLDAFPPEAFLGTALVLDCRHLAPGASITEACLAPYGKAADTADFLLFATGWEARWGHADYFTGYPCPDQALLLRLAGGRWRGIGVDAVSIDPVGSVTGHRLLFSGHPILILENLCGLTPLIGRSVSLAALPLAVRGADGAPARVVAYCEEA